MDYCNYDRLGDPLVRDLAWVAWSPPLLTTGQLPIRDPLAGSIWRSEPERLWRWLTELDQGAAAPAGLLAPNADYRLGTYYERLWHVLLEQAPDVRILARNLQLQDGNRTLGELDLLLESAAGEVLHLELAIKFYMGCPALQQPEVQQHGGYSPESAWLGPNPLDSLADKVARLRDHQLPLVRQFDLTGAGLPTPDRSCAWLQGQLFFPLSEQMQPPADCPEGGTVHRWCSESEWSKRGQSTEWAAMPHKRWLMPPSAGELSASAGTAAGRPDGLPPPRARMLVRRTQRAATHALHAERLMLVADDWPRRQA